MISQFKFYFKYLILVLLISCNDNSINPPKLYTIEGKIQYEDSYVQKATISLDNKVNLTTETDNDGYFKIDNVPEGNHQMNIKKTFENGAFSENTSDITVTDNVYLDHLRLPKAIFLYPATQITHQSVHLSWSPTDANDFQEYRVYRHTSPGLDENTGEFIYVSTIINDTSFTDSYNLSPSQTYYYRVFVMNNFGRLGGSNLINVKTNAVDIIENGSFEETLNNWPINWVNLGGFGNDIYFITIDDTTQAADGDKSLRFYLNAIGSLSFSQTIDPSKITSGKRYKISFMLKVESMTHAGERITVGLGDSNGKNYGGLSIISPLQQSDWIEYSFEATIIQDASVSNYDLVVEILAEGSASSEHDFKALLDDFKMKVIE